MNVVYLEIANCLWMFYCAGLSSEYRLGRQCVSKHTQVNLWEGGREEREGGREGREGGEREREREGGREGRGGGREGRERV